MRRQFAPWLADVRIVDRHAIVTLPQFVRLVAVFGGELAGSWGRGQAGTGTKSISLGTPPATPAHRLMSGESAIRVVLVGFGPSGHDRT
jgi:hypothetical protein